MLIELNPEIVDRLSKTELAIVRYINEHEDEFSKLSIVDIAYETFSSPATVSRAIKKCNVAGFSELRFKSIQKEKVPAFEDAGEIIRQSLNEVQAVTEYISIPELIKAKTTIQKSARIYVLGRGLSANVAEEFSMKLQLLDMDSMFIRDPNIIILKSKHVKQEDVVINFSLNGMTEELVQASRNARCNGAKVITFCCNSESVLISLSDIAFVGYSDSSTAICDYEVKSILPLQVMSRIMSEYLAMDMLEDNA